MSCRSSTAWRTIAAFGDRPYHGRGGPIPVYRAPLDQWGAVDKALARRGARPRLSLARRSERAGRRGRLAATPINSRDGVRVSTNDGYLEPARGRPNLEIRGDALVDRVLLDGRRAGGVRARIGGEWQELAAREVILAAGAIHCPPILMRSGIGPAEHLRALGIGTVEALPVGDFLFDHPFVRMELKLKPEFRTTDINARHTNCCIKYSSGLAGAGRSDMIIIAFNHGGVGGDLDPAMFGEACINVCLFECFSRGTVRLASADPLADPVIEMGMLEDERDLARMRDGARRLMRLGAHPVFEAITTEVQIGSTGRPLRDLLEAPDAAVDDWLMQDAADAQHGAGSCRMGPYEVDDGRSVVDPDGRVRGIAGLRVADASIMPEDCRANTNLTTIMIGEHIADRIRRVAGPA